MTQRLSIKDTIQEWVTKINDAINLGTVDGYFRVLSENGLDITLSSGNVRKSSTQFTVAQSTLTLPTSQDSVIGIDTTTKAFLVTSQATQPSKFFVPLYLVSTSTSVITSLQDVRTWAVDDSINPSDYLPSSLPANITPSTNSVMAFELTNDTTLTIKVQGSDGVVRSTTLTLS